jgi:predicted transglutaminase-like cysteine proteinase
LSINVRKLTLARQASCAGMYVLLLTLAIAATSQLGFSSSVTPGLNAHYVALFGSGAQGRLEGWKVFVRGIAGRSGTARNSSVEVELLEPVNAFFNRLPFATDLAHWKVEDYWATPAEALASNGADCEDFAIAKYYALKELGVPIARLRITYVKAVRLNQAHMVLAYYPEPNAMPLILDNLEARVRPASERADLIPVYSFNDEDVLLARPGEAGASAGSSSQIRLWRYLLEKLEKELLY